MASYLVAALSLHGPRYNGIVFYCWNHCLGLVAVYHHFSSHGGDANWLTISRQKTIPLHQVVSPYTWQSKNSNLSTGECHKSDYLCERFPLLPPPFLIFNRLLTNLNTITRAFILNEQNRRDTVVVTSRKLDIHFLYRTVWQEQWHSKAYIVSNWSKVFAVGLHTGSCWNLYLHWHSCTHWTSQLLQTIYSLEQSDSNLHINTQWLQKSLWWAIFRVIL